MLVYGILLRWQIRGFGNCVFTKSFATAGARLIDLAYIVVAVMI